MHIKVRIEKVGFTGMGVGKIEHDAISEVADELKRCGIDPESLIGKKVLIAHTLPDETVEAQVTGNKKKFVEAVKVKTLIASPHEVKPRCAHFAVCGGCTWQNLDYETQLKVKEAHVRESLHHLGGFSDEAINAVFKPIIACEHIWNYRNKVEFSFGWDENMQQTLGFHVQGRRYDIFDLRECHLVNEKVVLIAREIAKWATVHELVPYRFNEGSGYLRSVVIRQSASSGEILVNILTAKGGMAWKVQNALLAILAETSQTHAESVFHTQVITQRGQPTRTIETLLAGKNSISETLTVHERTFTFPISPSSFFQTNTRQAEKLYEAAISGIKLEKEDTILDLFCGTGTIASIVSPHVKGVIGIEINPDAIHNANENARINGLENIEFLCGDVTDVCDDLVSQGRGETIKGAKIIVDPPRSGLTPAMIDRLADLTPEQISYVSCNPATQARDLKALAEKGYTLSSIQPVDMFPHTYHIENIAVLQRSSSSSGE